MKFNSITTETKFKYLSKKALGTAKITDVATFTPIFIKHAQDWYEDYQVFTNIKINKAKCIDLSQSLQYRDADGNTGYIMLSFPDKDLDCKNIILGQGAFNCYYMDVPNLHPQKIVRNLIAVGARAFFDNTNIEEVYNMKVIGTRYGMFEAANKLRVIKGLDLSETTDGLQMFTSFENWGPLTVLEFTGCKYSIDISNCKSLPREQLVKIFTEGLEPVTTTQTITLGSTLLAKLTDEDKKIATDKGWTIA
jgi:hypothetical protein